MATRREKHRRNISAETAGGSDSAYWDDTTNPLRQALEAADIGLWEWDLVSNRMVMSEIMKTILDIGAGGRDDSFETFLKVIYPEDKTRVVAALKKAIKRKSAFDEEFRTKKRDRKIHWMRIRGRVFVGTVGAPERVMGSIHDKTKRKMAYDTLASARSELEEKIKERTRELVNSNELLRKEIAIKNNLQRQIMEISEKEQRRIGQDLHDSLSQQLGGIVFMGQVLFEKLKKIGLKEAQDMEKLIAHLQNALIHTRDLSKGLYPMPAEGGLVVALNELGAAVGELYNVKVTVQFGSGVKVSNETVAIHLYRIVQEALNNAIRHGKATRVAIRLFRKKNAFVLTVADNGVGFPEKLNRKGIGLNIMEYRASSIGASFKIETGKNQGVVVKCVFRESGALADLD